MISKIEHQQAPLQPMGWPIASYTNIANQARAAAEAHRQRIVQLEKRNRRMRSALAGSLALMTTFGFTMLALGLLLGYAVGTGLIRVAGQ